MKKLIPPPTPEEIKSFEEWRAARPHLSLQFKLIFPWSDNVELWAQMERVKHLPNPYLAMISKK